LFRRFIVTNDKNPRSVTLIEEWCLIIFRIDYTFIGSGCIEVFWELPHADHLDMISHYQILLNKVSYKHKIHRESNRVTVQGLAGGRNYDLTLMVYPKDTNLIPHQSNVLNIKSGKVTSLGGPVISLKANLNPKQITVCWQSINTNECPISHYELILNEQVRETIKTSEGNHQITIDGCNHGAKHSFILIAKTKEKKAMMISNQLDVLLPLNLSEITLPDPALRKLPADFYDEYIEIFDEFSEKPDFSPKNDTKMITPPEDNGRIIQVK
jgi:hypothetical protein